MGVAREQIAKALETLDYEEVIKNQGPELNQLAKEWTLDSLIAKCKASKIKAEDYMNTLEFKMKSEEFKKKCYERYAEIMTEWHDLQRKMAITKGALK